MLSTSCESVVCRYSQVSLSLTRSQVACVGEQRQQLLAMLHRKCMLGSLELAQYHLPRHARSFGQSSHHLVRFLRSQRYAHPANASLHLDSLQSCGNGIVEAGEDCDPGSSEDACCDRATCKFVSGAVCSTLNSLCCTSQCQLASAGTVCRPAVDAQCDKAETCSGSSKDCPEDEYQPNGKG